MGGGLVIVEEYPELKRRLRDVEKQIRKCLRSRVPFVREACEDLLEAGGKRIRPTLALVASGYSKGVPRKDAVSDIAAAVEIIHMATLVHDDIIDESRLRRGRETVQSRWGKDVAVFLGDYLLTQALLLLSSARTVSHRLILATARGMKYICEGEIRQFAERYRLDLDVSSYLRRIRGKTALLFALSCGLGAECADVDARIAKSLVRYGMNLGMAFQIRDDIMDFTYTQERTGKPQIHDVRTGVYTLPVILASRDRRYGRTVTRLALNPDGSDEWVARMADAVRASGSLDSCEALLKRYTDNAVRHADSLPPNHYGKFLRSLPETLCRIERSGRDEDSIAAVPVS